MKFTRELPANINLVRGYSDIGSDVNVRVGEKTLTTSCLFNANELIVDWPPRSVTALSADHFAAAFAWEPEIILLGTGARQIFPAREIYAAILSRGIGFEVMDTGAACRTYNVLVSESRRAVIGVII